MAANSDVGDDAPPEASVGDDARLPQSASAANAAEPDAATDGHAAVQGPSDEALDFREEAATKVKANP